MKNLPTNLRIRFFLYKSGLYSLIFLPIIGFAFLIGKHIESIFVFVAYLFIRYKFPKTYHDENAYVCVAWSIVAFLLSFAVVLPIKYSILSPLTVAFILCFVLYKIADYRELKKKATVFNLSSCSESELKSRCRGRNVSERDTRIAVLYFIEKQTPKQIWQYLCDNKEFIEWDSVYKLLNRLRKRLK